MTEQCTLLTLLLARLDMHRPLMPVTGQLLMQTAFLRMPKYLPLHLCK